MDYRSFAPGASNNNTTPPPVLLSEPPKHLPKLITWTVLLLAAGLATYVGILYWQDQQLGDEYVPAYTPRIDETTNWETYSGVSGSFSYEFKYPTEWPAPNKSQEGLYSVISLGPLSVGGCEGVNCYTTNFSITTSPISTFVSDALETPEKVLADIKISNGGNGTLVSDSIQPDGSRVIIHTGTGIGPVSIVDVFYPTVQRKLHAQFTQRSENPKQLQTIASTFKFTK